MIFPLLIGGAAGISIVGSCIGYATAHPSCQWFGPVRHVGSPAPPPRIALTFDDGPTPGQTERVLKVLAEHGVPASFFCIGRNVAAAPDLLRAVADGGHLIANHSYDHPRDGCFRGRRYWIDQLEQTNEAIQQVIGQRPQLFRPPMGLKTPRVLYAARKLGMTTVTWTHRGLDAWSTRPEKIVPRLTQRLPRGAILVLHDGVEPGRRRSIQPTLDALPIVIDRVRAQGFTFAKLDEVLSVDAYERNPQAGLERGD